MSHVTYRKYDLAVTLSPHEAAQFVCGFDDYEQALFLAEMQRVSDTWETPACFQWEMVIQQFLETSNRGRRLEQQDITDGRRFMRDWCEYFECVVQRDQVAYIEELEIENRQLKERLRAIAKGVQSVDEPGAGVHAARVRVEPREG